MKQVFRKFTKSNLSWFVAGIISFAGLASSAEVVPELPPLPVNSAQVAEMTLRAGDGLNLQTLVLYPESAQTEALPVVLMDHGFLLNEAYYHDVLAQIASQGFVVVAPQAYKSGGLPFGKPSTEAEAKSVALAMTWYSTHLSQIIQQPIDFTRIGLVNHSRGSKVAVILLRDNLVNAQALAAIDPVDGMMDGSPMVTGTTSKITVPTLIIGTGLGSKKSFGQACAPSAFNYEHFWSSVGDVPSWLFVAQDYGHMDLLDTPNQCGFICKVCASAAPANPRADFRGWVGTTVSDFLRAILYKDASALDRLEAADQSGLNLTKLSNKN